MGTSFNRIKAKFLSRGWIFISSHFLHLTYKPHSNGEASHSCVSLLLSHYTSDTSGPQMCGLIPTSSSSATPSGCPTIQLHSGTISLELASDRSILPLTFFSYASCRQRGNILINGVCLPILAIEMFDLVTMRKFVQWFILLFGVSTCVENY